jgi:hypothetical protein
MTSRHTWNSLPGCCSANPDVTRLVVFRAIHGHHAATSQSGPLQIAEMSSTVRCAVMANRMSRACSWRSV